MEILSKVEIVKSFDLFLFILGCFGIAAVLSNCYVYSKTSRGELEEKIALCFNLLLSLLLCVSVFVSCFTPHGTGRYRYTVWIEDSSFISEIAEQYGIVEKHGEIWTLEDKENAAEIH